MEYDKTKNSSLLTEGDLYLFNEGTHSRLYEKLGAHITVFDDRQGTYFAVWAPDAKQVFIMGDFNRWYKTSHPLYSRGQSGIWEGFVPGVGPGAHYKYHIVSRYHGYRVDKADPLAFYSEPPPKTASVVWDTAYTWDDQAWMAERHRHHRLDTPMSIYEVHLGSWRRVPEEGNRPLTYRELAPKLAEYVRQMGFTHVELLPITEHPFYGSWGYQVTGYFSPTSRYGTPQDFMYLVDYLHQHGIGVFLDWVPSHFPSDEHGLGFFDGTHLYEHEEPQKGIHPHWNSLIFNYGRREVNSFLLSSALFWLDRYHIDGLRVDAVASILYLDYGRKEGEWCPNQFGGRENLEAIAFLRHFNEEVYKNYPDVQTIAEDSTAWPMVSRPTYIGGLGFGLKWDMGWMHDTLQYIAQDPIFRKYHHNDLTFRLLYAFYENFVLPLSHDEVVHGKGSLLNKMPGDEWQRFANLRLLYTLMYTYPGKKLLFMGCEFGQGSEWNFNRVLDWYVLDYAHHQGVQALVRDLNRLYKAQPALFKHDFDHHGFDWIDCHDVQNSIISYRRKNGDDELIVVLNFTPVIREYYRIGVPKEGLYTEIFNSDSSYYDGSNTGNAAVWAEPKPWMNLPHSICLTLPPLGALILKA